MLRTKTVRQQCFVSEIYEQEHTGRNHSHHYGPDFSIALDLIDRVDIVVPEGTDLPMEALSYGRVRAKLGKMVQSWSQQSAHQLICLSEVNADLDVFAIVESVLHMNLSRASYERFGLMGTKMANERYHLDFDLNKTQDRLRWALDSTITKEYDFIVSSGDLTCKVSSHNRSVSRPPLETCDKFLAAETLEWMGMVLVGCEALSEDVDRFLCSYEVPDASEQPAALTIHTITGMIPKTFVRTIWERISSEDIAGAFMSVRGFDHTPVAWHKPRTFVPGGYGTNQYMLLHKGEGDSVAFKIVEV